MLLAVLAGVIRFLQWRSRAIRRLLSASEIVHTVRGPIDCAIAGRGSAPAVLVLHGGLGGWDQGIALAEDLNLTHQFRVIAPSRPGYLRTPLAMGRTTDEAADAMICLLDALDISRAGVVGISGGGPTAVAIAMRHPQRVGALAMVCAISHRHVQPGITTKSLFGRVLFSSAGAWLLDLVSWIAVVLSRVAPLMMVRRVLGMTELGTRKAISQRAAAVRRDAGRLYWFTRLLEHSFPISPRKIGLSNDLVQFASLNGHIDGRIHCPVLVIHGRIDGNVPVAHAEAVLAVAEDAKALIIDDASHLLWFHPSIDEVRCELEQFLDTNS